MMQRRFLLKLTGFAVAAGALGGGLGAAAAQPEMPTLPPGTYQFSGRVRLQAPRVEISGIANAQQISWSAGSLRTPVASFTSFERFEQPWRMPAIQIRGGQLEALSVVPLEYIG